MPALSKIKPLPTHELAIRLFYLYDHFRREPVVDQFPHGQQVCLLYTSTCAHVFQHALYLVQQLAEG